MIYTIPEIISALEEASAKVTRVASDLTQDKFFENRGVNWSPAGYLQHLILSVKPYARGLLLPKEKIEELFGLSEGVSRDYGELVTAYQARLDAGVRAENYPNATPSEFKYPDDVEDKKTYLLDTWKKANEQFIKALENWLEEDLDKYRMIHPALGEITVREVCFFTIYHNQMHSKDIAID